MSAEATGWVFRHSTMKGAAFAVHLAVADSVSDLYDNRFWMTQAKTATKARVGTKAAREALNQLVEGGYLMEVEGRAGQRGGRQMREFVFLYPETEVVYEARNPNRAVEPIGNDAQPVPTPVPIGREARPNRAPGPIDPNRTQEEPKEACASDPKDDPDRGFETFWKAYPARDGTKVGKADALREWRKLTYDDKLVAFKAAGVMATRDRFPPDAHRWLRKRTFEDWIESAAPGSTAAPIRYGQLSDDERMRLDQGRRYRDKVLRQIAAGDDSEYDPGPDPGDEAYWAEWERTGILP